MPFPTSKGHITVCIDLQPAQIVLISLCLQVWYTRKYPQERQEEKHCCPLQENVTSKRGIASIFVSISTIKNISAAERWHDILMESWKTGSNIHKTAQDINKVRPTYISVIPCNSSLYWICRLTCWHYVCLYYQLSTEFFSLEVTLTEDGMISKCGFKTSCDVNVTKAMHDYTPSLFSGHLR